MRNMVTYRYPVSIDEFFTVTMPSDATILHVGQKSNDPSTFINIWAMHELDTDSAHPRFPVKDRLFQLVGTGHAFALGEDAVHICTWVTLAGFVWHLWDITEVQE